MAKTICGGGAVDQYVGISDFALGTYGCDPAVFDEQIRFPIGVVRGVEHTAALDENSRQRHYSVSLSEVEIGLDLLSGKEALGGAGRAGPGRPARR